LERNIKKDSASDKGNPREVILEGKTLDKKRKDAKRKIK